MRRIKWILTIAAVMAALTVLAAAPTWAQQDLDDDCVFVGGDTFCDVNEVSAVYDFGDCFFTDNDLFCRVIRFDGVADGFSLFGFDTVDIDREFDVDRDVDLKDVLDLDDDLRFVDLDGRRLVDLDEFDLDDVDDDDNGISNVQGATLTGEFDDIRLSGSGVFDLD